MSRGLVAAFLCSAVLTAAPITYTSVSCRVEHREGSSVTVTSVNQSAVDSGSSCSIPAPFNIYPAPALASASAGPGNVYIRASGADASIPFNPSRDLYWASASATFDTYETILSPGPVRPGFAKLVVMDMIDANDSERRFSVEFGNYSWSYVPSANVGLPITLGLPLPIHLHAYVSGGADPQNISVPHGLIRLSLSYTLFEADGVTVAPVTDVEVPEPRASVPLICALVFAGIASRRLLRSR